MRGHGVAIVAVVLLASGLAQGHGGLPISEDILWKDAVMNVPTRYWGVFIGSDGGPWRWICEEVINRHQRRVWARQGNGTFHTTDFMGVTSSRDGGCGWTQSTGEIQARPTSHVAADPANPARAFATTESGDAPWNALFETTDDGATWTALFRADDYLRGVAISGDGQRIYVTGSPRALVGNETAPPRLHVSKDGGKTWSIHDVDYKFEGVTPTRLVPMAVDPLDVDTVFVRVDTDPVSVLLRVSSDGSSFTEVHRAKGNANQPGVGGLEFIPQNKEMLIAAKNGLYRSIDRAKPVKFSNLVQAQCISKRGDKYYACSWNFFPDEMAIGRSDDGGETFTKVFQYADTVGSTTACPLGSEASKICPDIWRTYCDQLGAVGCGPSGFDAAVAADAGADSGTGNGSGGGSCTVGGRSSAAGAAVALLAGCLGLLIARRRARSG